MKNIIPFISFLLLKELFTVRIKWLRNSSKLIPCSGQLFATHRNFVTSSKAIRVLYWKETLFFYLQITRFSCNFLLNLGISISVPSILSSQAKKLQTETDSGVGYSTRIYQTNEESSHSYDMDNPIIYIYIYKYCEMKNNTCSRRFSVAETVRETTHPNHSGTDLSPIGIGHFFLIYFI